MIARAVLLVENPPAALRRLAGMSLLERQLFILSRAGVSEIRVLGIQKPEALRLPSRTRIDWDGAASLDPLIASPTCSSSGPLAVLYASYLPNARALENLLLENSEVPSAVSDEAGRTILLLLPKSHPESPLALPSPKGRWAIRAIRRWGEGDCLRLETAADFRRAVPMLLAGTRKAGDGFMARVFDRSISQRITALVLKTPLAPNHMTLLSTAVGLAGAAQFAYGEYSRAVLGALLVWLHSVLDGCDGEMARLNFSESRLGAFLDYWGDNLVHLALFSSIALGLSGRNPWIARFGAAACAGALGSALCSYVSPSSARPDSAVDRILSKLKVYLAQRDFIYLLPLAAALDRMDWFLWAAGIGAPLYLAAVIHLQLWAGWRKTRGQIDFRPATAASNAAGTGREEHDPRPATAASKPAKSGLKEVLHA